MCKIEDNLKKKYIIEFIHEQRKKKTNGNKLQSYISLESNNLTQYLVKFNTYYLIT